MRRNKSIPIFLLLLIIPIFISLIGCGGGDGGNSDNEADSAELVNVSGYVLDTNGNPIEGAVVTISSSPITVTTDAEGYFSANVEVGQHEITIKKDSITIYSSTFSCVEDSPLHIDDISTSYDPEGDNADNDGDGYATDDCDDNDASINPDAPEICDDLNDNDCDRDIDYLDSDCDGYPSYPGNVMYFEPGRMLETTELNGKIFENGFSFSGWFNITQISDSDGCMMGTTPDAFYISYQGGNNVYIDLNSTGINIDNITNQVWNNLAVTYDLSNVNFYVNGTLVGTSEASGPVIFPNDEGDSLIIGGHGNFYGYATQLKIWGRGLSAEELKLEISRVDSSGSNKIVHQWLINEGTGITAFDTVGGVNIQFRTPYWVDLNGPYDIDHNSMFRVTDESKLLPLPCTFGAADFNQDGYSDLFYHGGFHSEPIYLTPLLVLQNDGAGNFTDASDTLVDGGLYYKRVPLGHETIIADLNGDNYEDIFIGQAGQHGNVEGSEANTLLLSNGKSGKLYPSEETIMSPPCTLTEPAFNGQKPCSSDTEGNVYYPDNTAPLVPIDINSNNHGSTSGDIDNDGDTDIFVGAFAPGTGTPVQPYFLINDGKGNFTAKWQIVPNKAFHTEDYLDDDGLPSDKVYVVWHLKDLDVDGFLDLVMLGLSHDYLSNHIPLNQFDVEQANWDESVHDLVAWGTNNGIGESYTILDEDPIFWTITSTIMSADIDKDGDIDMIITKNNDMYEGQYLQVFLNNGDRTFTDVSQQRIPQDREIAHTLSQTSGEMREIDFNQDGCSDFYQQSFGLENDFSEIPHIMWLNNCNGYFTPIERRFLGKIGLMIPVDADDDGDIDIITQTQGQDLNGYTYLEHTLLRRTRGINMDKYIDTDRDGLNDIDDIDDDGDGVADSEDASPKDKYES